MVIAGFIISVFALLFALYTYLIHDRKMKKQSSIINQYQLEKFEVEKLDAKKAIVEANVIKHDKGKCVLKVYNKGKSIAKNVNVVIPNHEGYSVIINPCPIDIRPQNSIEIIMAANIQMPDKVEIEFVWTDDTSINNRDKQTIQL